MVLYVDETENKDYFVVSGLLVDSLKNPLNWHISNLKRVSRDIE